MIHNRLSSYLEDNGAHWGVSTLRAIRAKELPSFVLAQFQDAYGEQARVRMTPTEARDMAGELIKIADKVDLMNGDSK